MHMNAKDINDIVHILKSIQLTGNLESITQQGTRISELISKLHDLPMEDPQIEVT